MIDHIILQLGSQCGQGYNYVHLELDMYKPWLPSKCGEMLFLFEKEQTKEG